MEKRVVIWIRRVFDNGEEYYYIDFTGILLSGKPAESQSKKQIKPRIKIRERKFKETSLGLLKKVNSEEIARGKIEVTRETYRERHLIGNPNKQVRF